MRIFSKFKDYYDIGCAYHDPSIIYLREKKEIKIVEYDCDYNVEFAIIGFCGELYKCGLIKSYDKLYNETIDGFYDQEKFDKFLENIENVHKYNNYGYEKYPMMFENPIREKDKFLRYFEKYNCPIFAVHYSKIVINPCLKDYMFFKQFDPYTAYNRIERYLDSVLINKPKPIPKMSDEDMAEIKGFNKYSFRKDKSEKKRFK